MKPIVYVNSDITQSYEIDSFFQNFKDRFNISIQGESFIKELGLTIANVKLPPNFNKHAYTRNMLRASRIIKADNLLVPKTYRPYDYMFFNIYQKKLLAFSIVKSIRLMLRVRKKALKNSCIVIYDAADDIHLNTICELAKECKYCILLSKNVRKVIKTSDYIIANFGMSPIVTSDLEFAFKKADFVISSEDIEPIYQCPVWYMNNRFKPDSKGKLIVNDVTFLTPWDIKDDYMNLELLGGILSQMEEKDVEKSLKYNGIFLDKIKYNDITIH